MIFPTVNVPLRVAPVDVTTTTLLAPFALIPTFPLRYVYTSAVPLAILNESTVAQANDPLPFVCKNCPLVPPVIITFPVGPKLLVAETFKLPMILVTPVPLGSNIMLPFVLVDDIVFSSI